MYCHVGWLVLLLGGEERNMFSVLLTGLSCCWPVGKREEGENWLTRPFMLSQGGAPGRMVSVIHIGRHI